MYNISFVQGQWKQNSNESYENKNNIRTRKIKVQKKQSTVKSKIQVKYLLGVVKQEHDINYFKIAVIEPFCNVCTALCVISELERDSWISDEDPVYNPRMQFALEHAAQGKTQFEIEED